MHDVHRDSLIQKRDRNRSQKTAQTPGQPVSAHDHDHHGDHGHDHHEHDDHDHVHDDHDDHGHDHGHDHDHHDQDHAPAAAMHRGHEHSHDEDAYAEHHNDLHRHHHHDHEVFGDRALGDRAYAHVHEHAHTFRHHHHHAHDPQHEGLVHKIFKDPVRDWFALALMLLLIAAGYYRWLPGDLSAGMLVCAALIGLFPIVKNALFDCIARRTVSFELAVGLALIIALIAGYFLPVALAALLLLAGSFMRLNFGWRSE